MTRPKIVVTRKWPSVVEEQLNARYAVKLNPDDQPMTADELKQAMQTADALLPTVTDSITADIINVTDRQVKIISTFGVGYNNIDIEAARNSGLPVTNTPGVLTDCTADIAMLLLLTTARRGMEGDRLMRNQSWSGWAPTHMLGTKVTGKTLGLIGFGRIGQAMAKRAHHGFGMKIKFYSPRSAPAADLIEDLDAKRCATLEQLLSESDFVSLHCPGGRENRHLINEQALSQMRPTAHLINTARGDVVDSQALITALKENRIAGAALDVYENEPDVDQAFLELDNISLLPHLGSATDETRTAMGMRVLANIEAFFSGKEPADRVA